MLGLPHSTEVNRRLTKEKLYSNVSMNATVREVIKTQIESVIWRNKLSDSTISIAVGEVVKEIQIFEVAVRQRILDKRILPSIANAIPYKILFVLTFGDEAQAWAEAAGELYFSDWFKLEGFALKIEGLNFDTVYENLARQIAGGRLGAEGDLAEAVNRDKQRQRIERDIYALEKKVLREKQFNHQVELNEELRRLRAELEGLG